MADVFSVDYDAPIASTSRLDDTLPTLAQLLQETVHQAAAGTSSSRARSNSKEKEREKDGSKNASTLSKLASLASLPSLSTPASRAYISSLLSKDLPSLLREPDELSRQSDVLDADLANLCFRSTGDLLGVGDCVDGVEDGFGQMQDTLDSLLSCTEQLSSACTSFTSSINPVLSSRSRLNLVRSNISSIEDILSIPRLVSTCVRGGWWSEAMELAYRARDLEQILRPSSSGTSGTSRRDLLGKVREEVEVEVKTLRARIIEGLRGRSLKLPSAVRSIGLLRRMSQTAPLARAIQEDSSDAATLSEPELRLTFLASRWDCLRSQLEQIEVSADSGGSVEERVRYIKRWIEVWRELVGETVTIYTEIFLSSSTSSGSMSLMSPLAEPVQASFLPSSQTASPSLQLLQPHTPLSIFLSQALSSLRQLLLNQLPHIHSISSLASLQTQISYCSTAFAKFGFDFRFLPNQLITARVLQVTLGRFTTATEVFARDLSRSQTQSGARGGRPRIVLGAVLASDARASILSLDEGDLTLDGLNGRPKTSQPPSYIALFPPLAKLLNAHASALNELRLLPLLWLYPSIRQSQTQELQACAEQLEKLLLAIRASRPISVSPNPDQEALAELEQQETIIRRLTVIFCRSIVPWCSWALQEGVYPDLEKEQDGSTEGEETRLKETLLRLLETVGIQEEEKKPESLTNGNGHVEDESPEVREETIEEVSSDSLKESQERQANGTTQEEQAGEVPQTSIPLEPISDERSPVVESS